MNILPHKYSQFKEKSYWNNFFASLKHTQNQFFEWYGSYSDYKAIIEFILKQKQHKRLFHVGCGKSTFSEDLWSDHPELNILNCDYSESIIEDMKKRSSQLKIKMQYVVCDLLQKMPQEYVDRFDMVLDKGTLDALLPEQDKQNTIKQKYFGNMSEVLQKNGDFIVISLLQPFVLRTLLQYFFPSLFSICIYECVIKDSKMQPFLIHLSKEESESKVIKFMCLNDKKPKQYKKIQEVMAKVQQIQRAVEYSNRIKKLIPGLRTKYNVFEKTNKLRYIIDIIDNEDRKICLNNTCAVFIVPQGKQNSYIYDSDEGVKEFMNQVKTSRLLLTKLVTGNKFESLQQVKHELNGILPDLIQNQCDITKVPYLTDGDSLGTRDYVYEDERFLIQQVLIENQPCRRMFLKTNLTHPIDEFKLIYMSVNNPYFQKAKDIKTNILPIKKGMFSGIDKQNLCLQSKTIYTGLFSIFGKKITKEMKVLVLGNFFSFSKFISDHNQMMDVTVVIQEKNLLKLAQKYFDFTPRDNLNIVRSNMINFVRKLENQEKFDLILSDFSFKNEEDINKIHQLLDTTGVYVCKKEDSKILEKLSKIYFPIYESNEQYLFSLKYPKIEKEVNSKNILLLHQEQLKPKVKGKIVFDWEAQQLNKLILKYPNLQNQEEIKRIYIEEKQIFLDPFIEVEKPKKKKKGKKK